MASEPAIIPSAWAANNTATEEIPATTSESGKASWDQGFPIETSLPLSQGGIPPRYGDFNGILRALSEFAFFAQAGGTFAWRNSIDYAVGSIVVGTDGSLYRAASASGPSSTAVNPVGDTSGKWERITSQSDLTALSTAVAGAVSDASAAVSTAGAAQSAVTTLDANVVKKSGDQEVGGQKTFTSAITVKKGAASIVASDASSYIQLCGGANNLNSQGATITINGAGYSSNPGAVTIKVATSSGQKLFVAKPDGTLTWDGKDIITDGGNQTVGGVKTFTESPIIQRGNPYLIFTETDVVKGVAGAGFQSVSYRDKNGSILGGVNFQKYNNNVISDVQLAHSGNTSSDTEHKLAFREDATSVWFFMPLQDDVVNLGGSGYRWKQLYAGTTTIATSDERLKDNIDAVPDEVLDAWGDVQWAQYQMRDAIAEKGTGNARLHNGLIAQRIDAVFKAHGLDASRYGLFCHDAWEADGEREAGDEYSLRYTEALAMEAAYQRRRAGRAEARIEKLEEKLVALETYILAREVKDGE